jgi:hypothetical protein
MITNSQARNMAESNWGRGGTTSYKTNRKGAFYFSCSGHGGFVIDARCLTDEEREKMKAHLKPEVAIEIVRSDGSVRRIRGPFSRQNPKYYPHCETIRSAEIFFAEEDCDWAVPVVVAGITIPNMSREDAIRSFCQWQKPSNHERLALLKEIGEDVSEEVSEEA